MNIVRTPAPIAISELKKFFADKTVSYLIDYDESSLKGQKLLTYLGNLDLPCDIALDFKKPEHFELLEEYLITSHLVKVPTLEKAVIECLLVKKQLITSDVFEEFVNKTQETLEEWESRLDSLTLYNMWILESDEFKSWVETHQADYSDTSKCVNFVNLLRHEDFYQYYLKVDQSKLKNYKNLFNEYCFKGKNLYEFWAVDSNPMFLLTWSIASGHVNTSDYLESKKKDIESISAQS